MTRVAPLGLRLFLEGIEVPVIAAQVSSQQDSPAAAAIQIVPTDMALHFLPRTLVHLFFLDPDAVQYPSDETEENSNLEPDNVAQDRHYKLLFSGEVIGFNYSKTPTGRSMVLQCLDLSSYWDICYQWFADYSVGGSGLTDKSHSFAGAGEGLFDNVASGHQWVIGNLLNTVPKSLEYQNTKGLLGGLIHLLEAIGGIRWRSGDYKGYNGVNDFFSIAELRYNLLGMIGAVEKDTTSSQLYAAKAFMHWLKNGMTSMGSLLSFRDILNHVNRYIFHNIYPNPSARYQAPDANGKATLNGVSVVPGIRESPDGKAALAHLKSAMEATVVVRDLASAISIEESTALGTLKIKTVAAKTYAGAAAEMFNKTGVVEVPKITAEIQKAITAFDDILASLSEQTVAQSTAKAKGDHAFDQAVRAFKDLKAALQKTRRETKTPIKVEVGGRLFNQLIMPETIFLSPPRCNVLFPDQYFSLQYSRNFLREPTRLALQVGLGILAGSRGSHLLDRFYYAPSTRDVFGKLLFTTMNRGGRILLPHETHSGIIPKFEWVTDGHRWGVKAAESSGRSDDMYASGKIGYLQRLANLQFFLHRWRSRGLAVAGVFNTRVVLGLPMVVMDKAIPPSSIVAMTERMGRDYLPTQFIGKVMSISHSVSQQGGATNFGLSYVRTHRGLDDEFLGVLVKEVSLTKTIKKQFRTDDLIKSSASYEGDRDTFIKILKMYVSESKKLVGAFVPDYNATIVKAEYGQDIKIEYDITKRHGLDYGFALWHRTHTPQKYNADGKSGTMTLPSSIKIELRPKGAISEYIRGALAPEDALMPSWYDDVWRKKDLNSKGKKNISDDVYMPLLGTRAITDDVTMDQATQQEIIRKQADETARETGAVPKDKTAQVESVPGGFKLVIPVGSIEEAIDGLSIVYGLLKEKNADVHEFINDYTYREIATLKQILGSVNLEFDDRGRVKDPTTMTEGFHSRAFGDYNTGVKDTEEGATKLADDELPPEPTPGTNAMHLLYVGTPASQALSVTRPLLIDRKGEKPEPIRPYLDPRGRASARVQAYMKELRASRGLFGV